MLLLAASANSITAQPEPLRRIDSWSGLIVTCNEDIRLGLPPAICDGIVAEVAHQATRGHIKFVALLAADTPEVKTAKAKAAGFDDAMAIEMLVTIGNAGDAAALDVDAVSRQHIMPSRPGQETQYAKIFTQSTAFARNAAGWQQDIAPKANQLLGVFFEIYLRQQSSGK